MIDWREYEIGVAQVYSRLVNKNLPGLKISKNQVLKGHSGVVHEIDVLISFDLLGLERKLLIECKNFAKKKVEKADVMVLHAKMGDIGNSFGALISRTGFQSGAKEYCEHFGISAIEADEQDLTTELAKIALRNVLPEEDDVAKPFYTIMIHSEGMNTGTYKMVPLDDSMAFMLFVARRQCEKHVVNPDEKVYPVTSQHLEFICKACELYNKRAVVFFGYAEEALPIPAQEIRELYGEPSPAFA